MSADIVLANATTLTVSSSSHPDILAALKGGGNNFGVVTSYTLQSYPIDSVWGGNMFFTTDKTTQLLGVLLNFTINYPDPKAAIIMTSEITLAGGFQGWILFFLYDGPTPPANVFAGFLDADPLINDCKTWSSYNDLLRYNDWSVVRGSEYTISTETTPLPQANSTNATASGLEVLEALYAHFVNTTDTVLDVAGLIGSIAFQPMPRLIPAIARSKGGDLLDMDSDVDRIIIEMDYSWLLPTDSDRMDLTTQQLYGGMGTIIGGFVDDGTLPQSYRPLFMNDAYFREDYWGRIRASSTSFAAEVAENVDPDGWFRAMQPGGWKV